MVEMILVDSMLGKLAKWLRVLGYDTHYQSFYEDGAITKLIKNGRRLLSRHASTVENYPDAILISSDHVKEQLHETINHCRLKLRRSMWFSRCLKCNVPLEGLAVIEDVNAVPDYILYQDRTDIRFCPGCGQHFWPGSHRRNMILQLEKWGIG